MVQSYRFVRCLLVLVIGLVLTVIGLVLVVIGLVLVVVRVLRRVGVLLDGVVRRRRCMLGVVVAVVYRTAVVFVGVGLVGRTLFARSFLLLGVAASGQCDRRPGDDGPSRGQYRSSLECRWGVHIV